MITNKRKENFYIPIKFKFFIALFLSIIWLLISIFLSIKWFKDLSNLTNPFIAIIIISGIAYIPGFINTFLIMSIILDKQPKYSVNNPKDEVTILIAAYNEESTIYNTLRHIKNQEYLGNIKIIVIDNNSTDNTKKEILKAKNNMNLDLEYVLETNQGKFNALNSGLKQVKTEYFITLDADTILQRKAINNIVSRIKSSPINIGAVAGSVLVRNNTDNILSRLQVCDYFLSIMFIKRMQGLFQGTLVAQGAFSIYKTDLVKELGGWSDAIGEDIILTWSMLYKNNKVFYEPLAIAFTDVPTKFSHFVKQRSRWARGMIEGLKLFKPWNQPNMYYKFLTGIDIFIIFIDFSYVLFFIPGCIFALFGKYYIVGPMLLLVLPLTFITFGILYKYQKKFYDMLRLRTKRNILGFIKI